MHGLNRTVIGNPPFSVALHSWYMSFRTFHTPTARFLCTFAHFSEKVLLWMDAAEDLLTLAKLYRPTGESYYRIQPDLGRE
jgi:hypothetical protein